MKNIFSGVYKIYNNINQKIYIGSSQDIERRINKHFNELRKNIHKNRHLQGACNIYGEENFKYEILENVIEKNKLVEKEQFYINKYNASNENNGYNICPNAYNSLGFKHTEESKRKMSIEKRKNPQKYARCGENHWKWGKKTSISMKNFFRDNHPDYNGEKSPMAKLTNEIVLKIRELYNTGNFTYNDLAKIYEINKSAVGKIILRERWKNI